LLSGSTRNLIKMADLSSSDVERAKLNFGIYDFDGSGKVDCKWLADLLRSLDLRPTNAACKKAGTTDKPGEKFLTFEEFLPIFSQVKKDKDVGAFEDLVEGLKVYDKLENGCMLAAELNHVLLFLGEKMNEGEVEDVLKACAGPEDEEGFIKYENFIKNVFAGPYPEEEKAKK